MHENTELAILPAARAIPTNDELEMKMVGQNRLMDTSKVAASNRSRMDIITKLFALLLLLIIATAMIYQLVRSTNFGNNTEKMSDQPNKSGNPSSLFVDLSRKNQELGRKLDELDDTMARNNKRLSKKLSNLDTITDQTHQKFEGRLQELGAMVKKIGFEPYLPYGPQSHIPLQKLKTRGWKQCFSLTYDIQLNMTALSKLENSCTAPKIMLACRLSNHTTMTALAWGSREQVLFKTTDPADYEVENGTGWYYYQETSAVSLQDPGVYKNPNYTMSRSDKIIHVTKGSIGFAAISDDFKLGSGYLWHDLFGYVNQEKGNSRKRMSWRILDYPSDKISINAYHKTVRNEAYRTGGNCGENKHLDSRKWERMAFEM